VNQGLQAVALGTNGGQYNQGTGSVAIGYQAGATGQRQFAVAIGYLAGATGQNNNSVVLNASGNFLTAGNTGLFVNPLRNTTNTTSVLVYDTTTSEIQYNGSKTFVIPHPIESNKYLVHACLEGPEAGIYYRGKGTIENGKSVVVELPPYVSHIGKNFTIQITRIYDGRPNIVYQVGEIVENCFEVYGENGSFYWSVFAERNAIDVEPLKKDVHVSGYGPYLFIEK